VRSQYPCAAGQTSSVRTVHVTVTVAAAALQPEPRHVTFVPGVAGLATVIELLGATNPVVTAGAIPPTPRP